MQSLAGENKRITEKQKQRAREKESEREGGAGFRGRQGIEMVMLSEHEISIAFLMSSQRVGGGVWAGNSAYLPWQPARTQTPPGKPGPLLASPPEPGRDGGRERRGGK